MLSALAKSELPFSQVLQALSEDQDLLEETSVLQTAFNLELQADTPEDSLAERVTVSTQLNPLLWPWCLKIRAAAMDDHLWRSACITPLSLCSHEAKLHAQVPRSTTEVDLEVFLQSAGKELRGELIFNADLFEESTAQRIAMHFKV